PDFIGASITLDGTVRTVIGIMPASFQFPFGRDESQFWIPHRISPREAEDPAFREARQWTAITLLKEGVSREQMESHLEVLSRRSQTDPPATNAKWAIESRPIRSLLVTEPIERTLWSLLAAVAMLLLIACANVGVLLLARAVARRGEFSIRMAIGAGWSRIGLLLMTENGLLSGMAGALGILFSWGGIRGLQHLYLQDLPVLRELGLDWTAFGSALACSVATTVLFAAAPIWFVSRLHPGDLKEASQHHSGGWIQTFCQDGLMVAQVSLAVVLLAGSGLMIQSTVRLLRLDPGLNTDQLYGFDYDSAYLNEWKSEVDPAGLSKAEASQKRGRERVRSHLQWHETMVEKLQAILGITSAAIGDSSETILDVRIEGGLEPVTVRQKDVGIRRGNYFRTLQARLLAGRFLEEQDCLAGEETVIINREMADRFWPDRSPLGGRLVIRDNPGVANFRVVGVVENIRDWRRDLDPEPTLFVPAERMAEQFLQDVGTGFFVRSDLDAEAFRSVAKRLGSEMSPPADWPRIFSVKQQHAVSTAPRRILMWLLTTLGALGLFLSALGVYAMSAYSVIRRTREAGIRMALGAQRSQIRNLFMRRGLRLAFNGCLLGLVAAAIGARYIESLLFQVRPGDPGGYVGALGVLGIAVLFACWLPARRAARVDLTEALRME
ncbi:MAG: ABC transporter permease, partial [Verrucomicrobiae bacterium]|nr:ABC transporter permease [Verrucomicrobiae bacterium]